MNTDVPCCLLPGIYWYCAVCITLLLIYRSEAVQGNPLLLSNRQVVDQKEMFNEFEKKKVLILHVTDHMEMVEQFHAFS